MTSASRSLNFEGIIAFAVAREEEAAAGYADLMAAAETPGLKELFRELRDEESEHKKLLEGLDPAGAASVEPDEVEDLGITDGLRAEPPHPDMSFQDALIFAARKEERAIRLYAGLAARARRDGGPEAVRVPRGPGEAPQAQARDRIREARPHRGLASSARAGARIIDDRRGGRTWKSGNARLAATSMIRRPATRTNGIPPGTRFEDLPDTWVCPQCGVGKEFFQKVG